MVELAGGEAAPDGVEQERMPAADAFDSGQQVLEEKAQATPLTGVPLCRHEAPSCQTLFGRS
jgi:hypothetical protein